MDGLASTFRQRQSIAGDVRSECVLFDVACIFKPRFSHRSASFAEKGTSQIIYRRKLVCHRRAHHHTPVTIIAIGVLQKSIYHEHIPKSLFDTGNAS